MAVVSARNARAAVPPQAPEVRVGRRPDGTPTASFTALNGRCEILFDHVDPRAAGELGLMAAREAWRIERKFSFDAPDNALKAAHDRPGQATAVDDETAYLVNLAARAYVTSGGRFDITSGLLRRAWAFDGTDRLPTQDRLDALLPHLGLERLGWDPPQLVVPLGIVIDLSALYKRYAVDRALELLGAASDASILIDFGGDLAATHAPRGAPWRIRAHRSVSSVAPPIIELGHGALATSGDSRRFMQRDGVRYHDLLDPRTGWPVRDAPRSVTVAATRCVDAGIAATSARLHGAGAAAFLAGQRVAHWIGAPGAVRP